MTAATLWPRPWKAPTRLTVSEARLLLEARLASFSFQLVVRTRMTIGVATKASVCLPRAGSRWSRTPLRLARLTVGSGWCHQMRLELDRLLYHRLTEYLKQLWPVLYSWQISARRQPNGRTITSIKSAGACRSLIIPSVGAQYGANPPTGSKVTSVHALDGQ